MKLLRPILALVIIAVVSCDRSEQAVDAGMISPEGHEEAVAKFQDAQQRFKTLIATVRDEKSFDAAKPGLDRVVSDWREVGLALRDLDPPSEDDQARFREMISEGHRRTEPTGEDMLSLISIGSREAEVTAWLVDFAEAGGAAGAEMLRHYGPTEYGVEAANPPELDVGNATINGLPIDQALGIGGTDTEQDER